MPPAYTYRERFPTSNRIPKVQGERPPVWGFSLEKMIPSRGQEMGLDSQNTNFVFRNCKRLEVMEWTLDQNTREYF